MVTSNRVHPTIQSGSWVMFGGQQWRVVSQEGATIFLKRSNIRIRTLVQLVLPLG